MMLYSYRFLIIILVLSVCVNKAQNIAFLNTVPPDTAINQNIINIKNTETDAASKSKDGTKIKAPLHSLAHIDNYSGLNRYSFNRKTFDPVSLSNDIEIEDNRFENINEYQMIDGTY